MRCGREQTDLHLARSFQGFGSLWKGRCAARFTVAAIHHSEPGTGRGHAFMIAENMQQLMTLASGVGAVVWMLTRRFWLGVAVGMTLNVAYEVTPACGRVLVIHGDRLLALLSDGHGLPSDSQHANARWKRMRNALHEGILIGRAAAVA